MTAVIHLNDGKSVSVENFSEVLVYVRGSAGGRIFKEESVKTLTLFNSALCTFVGEKTTVAFVSDVIQYVEFIKD